MNHVYNTKHQNRVTLGKLAWKALKNPGSDLTSPEGRQQTTLWSPHRLGDTPNLVGGDVAQVTVATWRRWGGKKQE